MAFDVASNERIRSRLERHVPLPPFPTGWYVVGYSHELPPGGLLDRKLAGKELVIFRGASGRAVAIDAWCPHMGAHFARTGAWVEGDLLRCAFHGFAFDGSGACAASGYKTKPPVKARAEVWPLREQNGMLLVWSGSAAPEWVVPPSDPTGYTPIHWGTREFTLRSHPQQMTENSVDIGHLEWVHGYRNVRTIAPLHTDGPYLTSAYAMRRKVIGPLAVEVEFTVEAYGLGYSLVHARIPRLGIETRQWVLATPTDDGEATLRLVMTVKHMRGGRPVDRALVHALILTFVNETSADFPMWEHTLHTNPPVLASGDGPIIPYRRWAAQFYD